MKEGWTYKRLGDICTIERGGSPRPIDAFITTEDKGFNWIKIGDAVEGSKYISSTKEKIKPEGLKKTRFVHKGDFILSNSMSFGKPYILNIDGCIHDGWLVIHDENDTFDKSFLYYLLGSPNMYREFKRLAVGGVVNNLNSKVVRDVIVPVPPLQEQKRIVAELDLLTEIIDKQKQQLNELNTLAQSIFYDMFGNPQTDERGWNMGKLSSICVSISDGSHNPPKGGKKSDYLMLSSKNIKDGVLSLEEPRYLSKDEFSLENKRTNVKKGDILLTIVGTIGRCCLFDSSKNIVFQRSVAILKPNDTTNNLFLMYQMIMLRMVFENEAKGVAQKGIYLKQLGNIMVIVPPKGLQDSFAQKIQAIESQKESINRSLAESQKLFDYTMDKYFG